MFSTKLEVDNHITKCLKNINSEKERSLRGYSFAKLYYKVGEYENARGYVSAYLQFKETAEAYHLLGQIFERLEKYNAAFESYKKSFKLDPKQNNLLCKICEILAMDNVSFDLTEARYFCEKAQKNDPKNQIIFSLKEKIMKYENGNPNNITQLYLNEIETQPDNIDCQIKLLRHLLCNDMVEDAFKYVNDTEHLSIFSKSLSWYEVSAEVLLKYRQRNMFSLNWEFHLLSLSILDKLSFLSLDEFLTSTKNITECTNAVFNLDQSLLFSEKVLKACPEQPLVKECMEHYKGQLSLYFFILLFKQAKKELANFKECCEITLPLLFFSYHTEPADVGSIWLKRAEEKYKALFKRWNLEGNFRCSQSGHLLIKSANNRNDIVVEKAKQFSSGMWRNRLFKKLFVTRDQQEKLKTSFFVNSDSFAEPKLKIPDKLDVLNYDLLGQLLYPDSLHHLIWIGINTLLPSFDCLIFENLPYTVKYLESSSAESLSFLDVQAFFYCSVFCVENEMANRRKKILFTERNTPELLPVFITDSLGTVTQHKWLALAYQMYKKRFGGDLLEIRTILVRGLEVVRCVGNHGLDVKLLIKLAKVFVQRGENAKKKSEEEANYLRGELYWKTALNLLEKMKNNKAIIDRIAGKEKLFNYKSESMSSEEVLRSIEEGKLFIATRLIKIKDYDKALYILDNLKDPYASYYQGEIYQKMAEELLTTDGATSTLEIRSQYDILLTKVRDCYYLTLDRLRDPSVDQRHPLNGVLNERIECIEKLINGLNSNDLSYDLGSRGDENIRLTPKMNNRSVYLTPRLESSMIGEARPSPERLEAQLRQVQVYKDNTNQILQNIFESLNEMRKDFKLEINKTNEQFEQLRQSMKVDDLVQDLKNVKDSIYEIKMEIGELKSNNNFNKSKGSNQLTDEDLYVLDEEYGTDYSNLSNLNQNLYSNYPNRIPTNPLPYGLYPGMYAPSLYPFPGLPLPTQTTFPQEQPQITDFRSITQNTNLYSQQQQQQQQQQSMLNTPNPNSSFLNFASQQLQQHQQPQQTGFAGLPLMQSNLFKDTAAKSLQLTTNIGNSGIIGNKVATTAAPVNVVITSSDPLPKNVIQTTQVLAVTIPPQHLKGNKISSGNNSNQPHNYQIAVSTSTVSSLTTSICTPSVFVNKETKKSIGSDDEEVKVDDRRSPDFKPIIPLPDEVPVKTGEENEEELFSNRAKLYRFDNVSKEWKERGIGILKILREKTTKKVRLLMRREIVLKICANHFLNKDMTLSPMPNSDRAFMWIANDYADEKVTLEKLCVRFKMAEDAANFRKVFDKFKDCKEDEKQTEKTATGLGGFVFTSTPTFKPKSTEDDRDEEGAKALQKTNEELSTSPFASFSFNKTTSSANSNNSSTSLFLTKGDKKKEEGEEEDDFKPTENFKPVVPLPALVDVKTGEENEILLFKCRGKLLRYVSESEEWKEKGIGEIKILKDKKIRLLMRREQVHKVCCNHQLLKGTKFTKMNPKVYTWCAQDYADGVLKPEVFAIRFKEESEAEAFIKAVLAAQDVLDENNNVRTTSKKEEKDVKKREDKKIKSTPIDGDNNSSILELPKIGFGDKFKQKSGTWECKNCYIINDGKSSYCVACENPKAGISPKKIDSGESGPQFSFGISNLNNKFDFGTKPQLVEQQTEKGKINSKNSWGDAFKPKVGTWNCTRCLINNEPDKIYCVACEGPKEEETTSMAASSVVKKDEKIKGIDLSTPGLKFNFGIGSAINYGTDEATLPTTNDDKQDRKEKFHFGSPQKYTFEFTPKKHTTNVNSNTSLGNEEDNSESYVEDEGDHIYFKPVVPLPDKIDVKTGEEGEEVLYCHRAKLFRFVDSEWKERGLGDIKILRNVQNNKLRVVMRREQVLKICLNHWLTDAIQYNPKDDKTWLFSAPDYSENELNHWQFCLRFKTAQIASEFKERIDSALGTIKSDNDESSKVEITEIKEGDVNDDSDVEFVSETTVTPEEEAEALRLKLPPKFMSYKQLEPCQCEICKKDDELLSELLGKTETNEINTIQNESKGKTVRMESKEKTIQNESKTAPVLNAPKFVFGPTTATTNVVFGTTPSTTFSFGKSDNVGSSNKKDEDDKTKIAFNFKPVVSNSKDNNEKSTAAAAFNSFKFSLNDPSKEKENNGNSVFLNANKNPLTTTGSIFNFASSNTMTNSNIFGTIKKTEEATTPTSTSEFFKVDPGLSFASIAAKTPITTTSTKSEDEGNRQPFTFLNAGAPVFQSLNKNEEKKTSSTNDNKNKVPQDGGTEEETADNVNNNEEDYDPHYEPIVPLPDKIQVSTGEEEEVVMFNERAKLYRFDVDLKEWKERGVGNFKILNHPLKGTYRLLLRREQVHKVVLNMLITNKTDLQPLSTSDKAWMWFGYNYTEDGSQEMEKLAVKFKTSEMAGDFKTKISEIIDLINLNKPEEANASSIPSTVQHLDSNSFVKLTEEDDERNVEEEDDEDEEDEDNEEDYDERSTMFSKGCKLSEFTNTGGWQEMCDGEVEIYYDSEMEEARVEITDFTGEIISNTMIAGDTHFDQTDNECIWNAMELKGEIPYERVLKLTFYEKRDAARFRDTYLEASQYMQRGEFYEDDGND